MTTRQEYKQRIDSVIDHILKNLNENVSLEELSAVASYSPFHLQRVFKQVTGLSPKQYTIKLRLERAFHLLIVHRERSILEIAVDSGFSSLSVFSRAVKNYFGLSPEAIRSLSQKDHQRIRKILGFSFPAPLLTASTEFEVNIINVKAATGIYELVSFNDPEKIRKAFEKISSLAKAHDLLSSSSQAYGIIGPDQGHNYMAFISVDNVSKLNPKIATTSISPGKFAVISCKGEITDTMKAVHYIFHKWLPGSGYKVADRVVGFETFSSDPSVNPYQKIERKIHISVQAT